jgi:hypothetical protein
MNIRLTGRFAGLLVAALLPFGLWAETPHLTIPAGSVLHIKLRTTLTSKTSKTGDKFTGVVDQSVMDGEKEVVPRGSIVEGHVAFIKPSGRVKGRGEMRIVLDKVMTQDHGDFTLGATLEEVSGTPCASTGSDDEGTIQGCGKSKKDALKDAGMGAAMGAGVGATVGLGSSIDCHYFGNCGGPGIGTGALYGAGLGAATALIYNLFKHEKQVILLGGTHLTFVINRTLNIESTPSDASDSSTASSTK